LSALKDAFANCIQQYYKSNQEHINSLNSEIIILSEKTTVLDKTCKDLKIKLFIQEKVQKKLTEEKQSSVTTMAEVEQKAKEITALTKTIEAKERQIDNMTDL